MRTWSSATNSVKLDGGNLALGVSIPATLMDEHVRKNWWWVLHYLRQTSATTEALLRAGKLETITDTEIEVTWTWSFHQQTMSQPDRVALAESIIEQILGRRYQLRCRLVDP